MQRRPLPGMPRPAALPLRYAIGLNNGFHGCVDLTIRTGPYLSDRGFDGQLKAEGRTGTQGADDIYGPVVQFQDFFGNRQPEPAVPLLGFATLVQLIKPVEYVGQLFCRDAAAGVADLNRNIFILRREHQTDGAVRGGILNGVLNQVFQHALYQTDIGIYKGKVFFDFGCKGDLFFTCF